MWKVLVADDEELCRTMIADMLKGKAECDLVINGKELIETYTKSAEKKVKYDAILLDIAMPDMDGLTILRKIRRSEEKSGIPSGDGIPIIMVTAYKENFLDAFNRGCDDYIVKPVEQQALIAKIEEKLNRTKFKPRKRD